MKPLSKADYLKVGMIPLLLGVLYYCLQPNKDPATISLATGMSKPDSINRQGAEKLESMRAEAPTEWPKVQSTDLGNLDPFDRRAIFPETIPQTSESDANSAGKPSFVASNLATLSRLELKVQAVFQSPQGIAALVGERILHIGDRLEDGTEVVGITLEQIVLDGNTTY